MAVLQPDIEVIGIVYVYEINYSFHWK